MTEVNTDPIIKVLAPLALHEAGNVNGNRMNDLRDELASYVGVLSESAGSTTRAEDRALYMQHLAASALVFFLLQNKTPEPTLKKWVEDERRAFGWSFLTGAEGKATEAAFQRFAADVESIAATH